MRDGTQLGTGLVLLGVACIAGIGGYIASEPYRRARFVALLEHPSGFLESSPMLWIGATVGLVALVVGIVLLSANKDRGD